jgi:hypothetical protein
MVENEGKKKKELVKILLLAIICCKQDINLLKTFLDSYLC